ncbi:MAG: hypothetical protein QNK30_06965 [Bacteroidales bacterium]|nr:hypothetical protein [Bacteroidales bacterium]
MNKFNQLWNELKRRKVLRVMAMYLATAFIVLEAADIMLPRLGLPDWTVTLVIVLIIIGIPITVVVSWVFDITPEGLLKTAPLNENVKPETVTKPNRKILTANNFVIAILLALVGVLAYPKVFNTDKTALNKAGENKKIIAILPFINNTGDSSNDHWEYGISELLINSLSTSEELIVIDNQTINEVINNVESGQTASVDPEIAKKVASKIKVESYIYGNYLQAGSIFRINLKLIDTKSSKVLETDFIEGNIDSIFPMVGSIALNIKNYLEIKTIAEANDIEIDGTVTTTSPEAYKYFIQGMEIYWTGNESAIGNFEKAIEIDTTFTSAYFFLNAHLNSLGQYSWAKKSLMKAYEGKDKSSKKMQLWLEAFISIYFNKNPYKSIEYFKQVTEIDPYSRLNWYWLGFCYSLVENYENAFLAFEQVQDLTNQLGPWKNHNYYRDFGGIYRKHEKYNKAQRIYKEGISLTPEATDILRGQAACALLQNDTIAANQYINQIRSILISQGIYPEPLIIANVGRVYSDAGRIKRAEDLYRLALKMRLNQGPDIDSINPGNNLYWYYSMLGSVLIENDINIEEGMEYTQMALDLSKKAYSDYHPFVLFPAGLGNFKIGKYQEALSYFKMTEERATLYNHRLHELIMETEKELASQNK